MKTMIEVLEVLKEGVLIEVDEVMGQSKRLFGEADPQGSDRWSITVLAQRNGIVAARAAVEAFFDSLIDMESSLGHMEVLVRKAEKL